jgi:phage tail sheath protein FI
MHTRRLTMFIEESIYRGTNWVVFEPNGVQQLIPSAVKFIHYSLSIGNP